MKLRDYGWWFTIGVAAVCLLAACVDRTRVRPLPTISTSPPLHESLQGDWEVGYTLPQFNSRGEPLQTMALGTLHLDETSYTFQPIGEVPASSELPPALRFLFETPQGHLALEYLPGLQAKVLLEELEADTFVATCSFESGSTVVGKFYVLVSQSKQLAFHSLHSEISLWYIRKVIP